MIRLGVMGHGGRISGVVKSCLREIEPDIQVVDVDLRGDRVLRLQHNMRDGVPLAEKSCTGVLRHVRNLWGYDVTLAGVDAATGEQVSETSTANPVKASP